MKKIILSFILIFSSIIGVYGAEIEKSIYSDVSIEHPYYQSIIDLTEKEIVGGFGNGIFAPNKSISYEEYTVILMRMFYNDYWCCTTLEGSHWADMFVGTAESIGLYSTEELNEIRENGITWDIVLRTSVIASDFEPYPFWLYDDSTPINDYIEDIKFAIVKQGIFNENFDWTLTPTRSEVVHLMSCITNEDYQDIEIPEHLNKFGVEIVYDMPEGNCSRIRNDALYELSLLPEKYVKAFNDNGWKLQIIEEMRDYFPNQVLASGMTHLNSKTITLSTSFYNYDKFILVHEFGHFVDLITSSTLTPMYMFRFEKENIGTLMGVYSQSNSKECFAECFMYVLINRNDEGKYLEMQSLIPMSLEYIENGYLDADGLLNLDNINEVTYKYLDAYVNSKKVEKS